MRGSAGNRCGAGKNAHGQLFEECLTLVFPCVAQHTAYFLCPHGAQLHLNPGHQISLLEGEIGFSHTFLACHPGN
jgi:hypothetical protein